MVSPKRPRDGSPIKPRKQFRKEEEAGFENIFGDLLSASCGDLSNDEFLDYLHSKCPEFLPFMTAKAIRMQFLEEGVNENEIPPMEELVQMVKDQQVKDQQVKDQQVNPQLN